VGNVGSGKSTLVSLVARVLDAGPDQIRIDGRPIQTIPLQKLRAAIGYVPQETFLFSDTIAANIAFGDQQAGAKAIEQAALEAGFPRSMRLKWANVGLRFRAARSNAQASHAH
jgi:ATP-binding cassette subfamily B protein